MTRLNPKWQSAMQEKLDLKQEIDFTSSCNMAVQWLIQKLVFHNRPYKLHNLGAGVKRLTTDTDVCPCCKQKLP